jgi:hypothetical protein
VLGKLSTVKDPEKKEQLDQEYEELLKKIRAL